MAAQLAASQEGLSSMELVSYCPNKLCVAATPKCFGLTKSSSGGIPY
jgi:hypothetical protein